MSKLFITDRHNSAREYCIEYRSRSYYVSSTLNGVEEDAPKRYQKSKIESSLDITLEPGAAGYTENKNVEVKLESVEKVVEDTELRLKKLKETFRVNTSRMDSTKTKNLQLNILSSKRKTRRPRVLRKLKAHLYNARQNGQFIREREIRNVIKQVRAGA